MTVIALCAVGAEKVVSNELKKLDFRVIDCGFGAVWFSADITGLYRGLMGLRVADRLLLECARFPAENFDDLFEGVQAIPWEQYLKPDTGLNIVKVRSNRSRLHSQTSVQAVTHKAAADRLCRHYRIRRLPATNADAHIRLYIEKDYVSVLLDISGDPLFKRGYRIEGGAAPLRETTAAALLLLAGWRRKFPLYDPFCGSGTIITEAALFAWDAAPGLCRHFALSDLAIGDAAIETAIRDEFLHKVDFSRLIRIYASDADSRAVSLARSNIARAYAIAQGKQPEPGIQLEPGILLPHCEVLPVRQAAAPTPDAGIIVTNPPYGKRLGEIESAEATYHEMAVLSRGFPGWKLAIISDHPGFESFFGKRADSCREITNGAINSYFYQYGSL